MEFNEKTEPKLGKLFSEYYLFVKRQKRDIDFKKDFSLEELHDLEYTILLLLNHIGTDLEQNDLKPEQIHMQLTEGNIELEPIAN